MNTHEGLFALLLLMVPFLGAALAAFLLPDLRSLKFAFLGPIVFVPSAIILIAVYEPGDFAEISWLAVYTAGMAGVFSTFPMLIGLTVGYMASKFRGTHQNRSTGNSNS